MFVTQPNAIIGQLSIVRYAVERHEFAQRDPPLDDGAAAQPQHEQAPRPRKKVRLGKNIAWRRIRPRLRWTYSSFDARKRDDSNASWP